MVRMIIGTLIELGQDNIEVEEIRDLLNGEYKNRVRYKAPSEGLYLANVEYGGEEYDQD
jgi:tRNA U38,U39,U40 pseudouridine synthase TruA